MQKKKRKTGLCGDLCESYLSVPETKPETLNPPPSSKRSGPRHHLAGAALCVQTNPDVQKSAGTVRACALSCTLNAFCQKVFYKPSGIIGEKSSAVGRKAWALYDVYVRTRCVRVCECLHILLNQKASHRVSAVTQEDK